MEWLKNAVKTVGEFAETYADVERQADELTDKLMRKTFGLERDDVKKVARVLVTQAKVTWK